MVWNYRVLKESKTFDGDKFDEFRIIEVHYDDEGEIIGWVDCSPTILTRTDYDDLKGTVEYVQNAFSKPVLTLIDGKLIEKGHGQ